MNTADKIELMTRGLYKRSLKWVTSVGLILFMYGNTQAQNSIEIPDADRESQQQGEITNSEGKYFGDGLNFLFGFGTGNFGFTGTDGQRGPLTTFNHYYFGDDPQPILNYGNSSVKVAKMRQIWVELYFDNFGIGLRNTTVINTQARTLNPRRMAEILPENCLSPPCPRHEETDSTVGQVIDVSHLLLTGQFWYPISASGSIHVGGLLGAGTTNYKSTFVWFVNDRPGDEPHGETSFTSSGSSIIYGAFLDLGGDGFGARFGWQSIDTSMDDFKGVWDTAYAKADASGSVFYLDLRFAL